MPTDAPDTSQDQATHPIILFDGLCAFCDGTVQLLLRLDRRERLRFAPLQSEAATELLRHYDVPDSIDSIVVVHGDEARVESDAAIAICRLLGFPWSLAVVFKLVPRPIRDGLYRFIARHRYRLVGRREACRMPEPGQQSRVIETAEQARAVLQGR